MSMIGNFLAVSPSKLDELKQNPEEVAEFIAEVSDSSDADGDFLDVDKSWHGIHFLLTGSTWEGAQPLRSVVLATRELGRDVGYGPARILTAAEVAEVSRALAAISPEQLKEKYDWKLLNRSEIYPQGWGDGDDDYIISNFVKLKQLYESAARREMAIIQWLN